MSLFSSRKRKLLGTLLVALQFSLLFWLATLATPKALSGVIPLDALILTGVSFVLEAWTLIHNRPGNFNIRPTPKAWGNLISTGPYRLIRHPMYTSVLLVGAALALIANTVMGLELWFALAVILLKKSTLEELWMREQHTDYGAYAQKVKRFVPWVI